MFGTLEENLLKEEGRNQPVEEKVEIEGTRTIEDERFLLKMIGMCY